MEARYIENLPYALTLKFLETLNDIFSLKTVE